MSSNELISEFPKRLKLYLVFVGVVFVTGYFSLVIIEDMSLIDALYFLIVTITTVGFGDITPTSNLSKIIVSVLIILSISTIALVSEQVVNRIVAINTQAYLKLPDEGLGYHDHIIICGFTKIAENISGFFQTRFFRIIVLDPHAVAVQRARVLGLEAYLTKPTHKNNLETVDIDKALALYLFMDDENQNVLTSLQARSLNKDLLIYASTEHELSIELGNLIGITRTYHYERIVASNINFSLRKLSAFALPNQLLSDQARFYQIMVSKDFDWKDRFPKGILIGLLDETLTEFIPIEEVDSTQQYLDEDYNLVITVSRDTAQSEMNEMIDNTPTIIESKQHVDTILVGGYNETSRHIIEEMSDEISQNYDFKILSFSKKEADLAQKDGFDTLHCVREELPIHIRKFESNSTLIINLFDRLTDSLLVNTVVRDTNYDIFIVQLAHNRIETEVLIKSGVNRILIPDILMSRGMFLILLATKNYINSIIWGNAHVFEIYIDDDHPFKNKNIKNLRDHGYHPLIYRSKSGKIIEHIDKLQLKTGDNLLVYTKHEIVRSADQLIDQSHS